MKSRMVRRILVYTLMLPMLGLAQNGQPDLGYFPGASYFRQTFTTPPARVSLQNPVRLQDFVVDNKLELSLRAFLELVMANNTDIQITRLTIDTARNAITRAYGPFDPLAFASFNATRNKQPATQVLDGSQILSTLNQPLVLNYAQTLQTGTQFQVNFNGAKSTTNSAFTTLNPLYSTGLQFGFTQPLLRGRGAYVNRLPITIARSRLRQTEYTLKDNLLRLVSSAEGNYWLSVQLRENLKVQEGALDLADKFLKRSQRELELGAISKLDIYQPEFQYAQQEANVSQARYNVLQQDDVLRRLIGADLDPEIRRLPIVLTENPTPPQNETAIDAESAVQRAMVGRPDLRSALQSLDVDDLSIRQASDALRPDFALIGNYTAQGRGGTAILRNNAFGQNVISGIIPGGISDSLDQLFGFNFPIYSFGLRLRFPIRDRTGQANLADALVQKRRDALVARTTEQQVRLDVLTAVNQVEASKASVLLAVKALDFAQKRLDAEQKKYELGTSQIFLVLDAQNNLISAQSSVVRESVGYRRNVLNLFRMTGELLDERGIVVQ